MSETLPARLFANAARFPTRVCHYYADGGRWYPVGWATMAEIVRRVAGGLTALGHQPGDVVAIVARTRREWLYCDLGVLTAAGVTVGIYPTLLAEQRSYILEHCRARFCVVEDAAQLAKLRTAAGALPDGLAKVIVMDPRGVEADDRVMSYDDLLALGHRHGGDVLARVALLGPADAATFAYTSGTTGPPRGAMITHGNIVAALESLAIIDVGTGDLGLSFLPLAHVLQRSVDYCNIWLAVPGAFARNAPTALEDMAAVRPTVMAAVPRVFETIYAAAHRRAAAAGPAGRLAFVWAVGVGRRVARLRDAREAVPLALEAQHAVARRLVFDRVREQLGGRVRLFVTGGAPIAAEVLEFFAAAGIRVLEGWGMTETFAAGTMNLPGASRFGSVGKPLPGVELRLDADGELLVRGKNLFSGYFRDDEATAAAFTSDGWFRTGDIARVDDRGFYYIVDRKSDLIVTAGGERVAPQAIEHLVRRDPRIAEIVVIGDRRPYLVALVSVAPEIRAEHDEAGVARIVESILGEVNIDLARFEQIKRFRLLPHDLSVQTGELTPTLTVKRRVVLEKFAYLVDEMYE